MLGKWTPGILVVFAAAGLSCAVARAQGQQSAPPPKAQSKAQVSDYPEADIGGLYYEAILSSSTGNGVTQTTKNGSGGMFEARYLLKPLVGFEFSMGFNNETETIAPTATNCGFVCNEKPFTDTSTDLIWSLDWVFSKQFGRVRPFAMVGPGWYYAIPGNSIYGLNNPLRTTLNAGGGVDYFVTQHLGVRGEFRGNFYTAPDLSTIFPSSGARTHMYQPAGGIFYAF